MDPHETVSMDAEKIMSNTWDFEFMVKKTLKKMLERLNSISHPLALIYKLSNTFAIIYKIIANIS